MVAQPAPWRATVRRFGFTLSVLHAGTWTTQPICYLEDLFVDPVPIVDGFITAPERPGHGLAFKPEILKDCRV